MSDLIAIGYPDETTALNAEKEAQRLASELIIQPDAIAAIVCDKDGKFKVTTSHHPVGGGASYGMFWGLLFGLLFFVPVFGMAIGAGLGTLMGKVEKSGIDREFQAQVRDLLQPGTSALFLVVEKVTPDKAVEALSKSAAPCSSRPCRKAPRRSCKRSFTVPKSLSPSRSNGAKQIL